MFSVDCPWWRSRPIVNVFEIIFMGEEIDLVVSDYLAIIICGKKFNLFGMGKGNFIFQFFRCDASIAR